MFTIMTDSNTDFAPEIVAAQHDLIVLPMTYEIGGKSYSETPEGGMPTKEFYNRLRAGEVATTSQINANTIMEAMTPLVQEGKTVLYIVFSSGLSGTYQNAELARQMVLEEHPDAKVYVYDSLCASAGQGLFVYHALRLRDEGKSVEDVIASMEENRLKLVHWFTVDDLNFLKRGGRCSPAAAFFGTMLSVKPVLHVNDEGKLIAREKVRGRKSALKALVDHMEQLAVDPVDQMVFISHGDALEDAQFVKQQIHERLGTSLDQIIISTISSTIGSHSGPGTVALFFLGKDRG